MTPPPARKCEITDCAYQTPDHCRTYEMQREELKLHIAMNHPGNLPPESTPKSEENESKDTEVGNRMTAKVDRPSLPMPCNDSQWALFQFKWNMYKSACGLSGQAAMYQLFSCMSEETVLKLYNTSQGSEETEEELMEKLKKIVLTQKSKMVKIMEFRKIKRKTGESVND